MPKRGKKGGGGWGGGVQPPPPSGTRENPEPRGSVAAGLTPGGAEPGPAMLLGVHKHI